MRKEQQREATHHGGHRALRQQPEEHRAHQRADQAGRQQQLEQHRVTLAPQLLDAHGIHDQQQRQHDGRGLRHGDRQRHQRRGE
jgi:hypothetical protein